MNQIQRFALIAILLVVGINALGGGYYGAVAGAPEVPKEWLAGTPFQTYFIPSLILLIAVGGSSLAAAVSVAMKWHRARLMSVLAGAILLGWISVQVAMIGFVSWLQPAMAAAALLILVLAWQRAATFPERT